MAAFGSRVPEHYLVREVLHCCQGIDGGKFVWYQRGEATNDPHRDGFACGATAEVSHSQRQLISRITELGWLLRRIKELCREAGSSGSVVHEALVAATNREVNNCYRLIAILEAQSLRPERLADQEGDVTDVKAPSTSNGSTSKGQLSLRRLEVWLSEPQERLRVIAACLETALPLRGGEVINALHAMSKHGDPLVRRSIKPLLEEACIPYLKRIARWITEGLLDGASDDFMIIRQELGHGNVPVSISSQWRHGNAIDASMQPNFISDDLAKEILTSGRTVAFLRRVCGDSEWSAAMAEAPSASEDDLRGDTYERLQWVQSAVKEVQSSVGSRVLEIIMTRECLPGHLEAIKRFLLLGQGDFVCALLDSASCELEKSAKDLSTFSLQGHVEVALRSCGTSFDHDALKRVQVRLSRALEGDQGWDVFNLTYVIDGPAAAVLSPDALAGYAQAFRLLWTIKHVDYAMAGAWHELNNTQHALNVLRKLEKEHGIDVKKAVDAVPPLLRFLHSRRSDMSRFVSSLGARLVFKVIEPAWSAMMSALEKATDLDSVIAAHEEFLRKVLRGTYSDAPANFAFGEDRRQSQQVKTDVQSTSATKGGKELRAALKAILDICGPIYRLSKTIQQMVLEHNDYLNNIKESERGGQWSSSSFQASSGVSNEQVSEIRSAAWRVYSSFDRHLRTFLSAVPAHTHLDLRCLALQVEGVEQPF